MKARKLSVRMTGMALVAVYVLLLRFAPVADAETVQRSKRDISGLWMNFPFTLTFDPSVKPGQPQKVLLQPEYDKQYKAYFAAMVKAEQDGKPLADSVTECLPSGTPGGTMMAFFPMEIVVTDKKILVLTETDQTRRIFTDGRPIPPANALNPTFGGFSVGRWEGDTLVVETAGIKPAARINGVPHSDALHIIERIRLLDDDTLEDEVTMTDAKAFKAPWVITRQYKDYNTVGTLRGRSVDPGMHPEHKGLELVSSEYICNENNRNLPDEHGVTGVTLGG